MLKLKAEQITFGELTEAIARIAPDGQNFFDAIKNTSDSEAVEIIAAVVSLDADFMHVAETIFDTIKFKN